MSNTFSLSLKNLNLQDFATFKQQTINFCSGFNVIIGETGSGKSLILDALQFILGHRADKTFIRKGAECAIIEASFHCSESSVREYFSELGFPFDDEVIIKRILYSNGKSKSFLNHLSCSLVTLSSFSRKFIDLVGQFENQKLLSSAYQLELLDKYGHHPVNKYKDEYEQMLEIQRQLNELRSKEQENQRRSDYLEYQLNELQSFNPSPSDELHHQDRKEQLLFQQKNQSSIEMINYLYDGDDHQVGLNATLKKIHNLLPADSALETTLISAKELLDDLNYKLNKTGPEEFNESHLEESIDRLDGYQKLKAKFHCTTEDFDKLIKEFEKELNLLQSYSTQIHALTLRYDILNKSLFKQAEKLHLSRTKAAVNFAKELTAQIQKLNMHGATLKIELTKDDKLSSTGFTNISLLAETNMGEGFHLVKNIASGGELSRILLAVRRTIASVDSIGIFLFDEIDTGIGGETALFVGKALKDVSLSSQVLAITHLPQIASHANKLIVVNKKYSDSRTWSEIKELEDLQIKDEVMAMNPLQ